MHGRLKIKTTAEQAAEKKKEREEKQKLYLAGLSKVFEKRASGTYDEECLKTTAQLLAANPDATTLWNIRREALLAGKSEDEESWSEVLQGELKMIVACLGKNHKSYGAWHHRCWVMENFPNPPWAAEVKLCDNYLKLDERNFHCWDYRRFVVAGSKQQPEDELKASQQLIEHNLSNYSAWHYRSKLLPLVHPPPATSPHPVAEQALIKELQMVVEAVFTDPSDQSPWFFLRWLVGRQEKGPRLLQVGYIHTQKEAGKLVCVFSQPVPQSAVPETTVDGVNGGAPLCWWAPDKSVYSRVWAADLSLPLDKEHSINLSQTGQPTRSLMVGQGVARALEWVANMEVCGEELSDTTRSTLEEVKENCTTLDELDPDNKWVMLTLVHVLWALDSRAHLPAILHYLAQLQTLDPLRHNYYADMKSKLVMETALRKHRVTEEDGDKFHVCGQDLTRVTHSHLLATTDCVDLSNNSLSSISSLCNLIACKELTLDQNEIQNLSPLSALAALQHLSVANNKIADIKQLSCLQSLTNLRHLNLKNNPVCEMEDSETRIRELLPGLQTLILR
uniref:Geranylgeranyl transferase type-2 subunit alpha n=1 Tax=Scylla olivacea TaxID=85551 RepID=A0A0P4WBN3_SCYOL